MKKPPVGKAGVLRSAAPLIDNSLDSYITFDEEGYCVPHGVSLVDPRVCSAILCGYLEFRHASSEAMRYLMDEFDETMERALAPYPLYRALIKGKIQGLPNDAIQELMRQECGATHSLEYISSLWRNKIPHLIASQAEDDYLYWYFTEKERGK